MAPILARQGKGRRYNHHCRMCKGAVKQGCLDKYHIVECEECTEVFSSFSKTGCNDHTYADGYNLSAKKVKSGLPADHRTPLELQQEAANRAERTRKARVAEAEQTSQERDIMDKNGNNGKQGKNGTNGKNGKNGKQDRRRGSQH
ncbi:hypothetical protein P171DRAFT_438992 [Karstenula rhodostoma CBS 690.94]|uniref:Uncharacterized protein n=1 Tax=Karstenula rhodostoma CBS 690.94 TaxID=1392251 RepID=A0A9P4PS49_9PLEO|nr:hypothetical protein P171DRAFT_438992 [Karstenula rhodostoma CBS 690.94]